MDLCGRCLRRSLPHIGRNGSFQQPKAKLLAPRGSRTVATATMRPSVLFFSSNMATLSASSETLDASQRWETDPGSSSSSNRGRHSEDVPYVTSPPIPLEYPPQPFSAYKPIPTLSTRKLLKVYGQLAKGRLTILNVLVAMSGVALAPTYVGVPVLLATAAGTALCSAAANTTNQLLEIPFDAQMTRTRNRPLVRRAISPLHAASYAVVTGIAGPAILLTIVNPVTAALGLFNVVLYAGVYTVMKRRTIWNTWVGSVVGALPAVMGWTACEGHILPSASHPIQTFLPSFLTSTPLPLEAIDNPLSPLALFALMFSWQFPHFNSLSHLLRASYAQAGYRMLSVSSPTKNALVALRHSVLLVPICSVLVPLSGLTTWAFALTSLPFNAIALRHAWRFWKEGTDKSARALWNTMLWHLPVILGLMMFHKQGMDWLNWLGLSQEQKAIEEPVKAESV